MLSSWINRAGDWNPQLVRELKSRFTAKNILMAIAASVLVQLGIMAMFYSQLPVGDSYSLYCANTPDLGSPCLKDANGNFLIDWQAWWTDMLQFLHWLLMYGLIVPGVFMLVTDLYQEEQRGTLNFIRLSPQSAWTILTGKLLGVPSLLYVAIAVTVPFYIVAATAAHLPAWMVVSFYVVLLSGCIMVYSAALLNGFLSTLSKRVIGNHLGTLFALTVSGFTAIVFVPLYMMWNTHVTWNPFSNFFLPHASVEPSLAYNPLLTHGFLLINLAIITFWIWQALHRCFHQPGATIISKKQSYGVVLYIEVLLFGLMLYLFHADSFVEYYAAIALISSINIVVFLGVIVLLSIPRQSLVDWARYRHVDRRAIQSAFDFAPPRPVSLKWDLMWGERSPAIVAIALNLLIFAVPLLPFIVLKLASWTDRMNALVGVVITINLILLYASIIQLALLIKSPKRGVWVILCLGIVVFAPMMGAILALTSESYVLGGFLFLFSPAPWITLNNTLSFPLAWASIAILGQWLAIATLNLQLARQLKQIGQSASKQVLMGGAE